MYHINSIDHPGVVCKVEKGIEPPPLQTIMATCSGTATGIAPTCFSNTPYYNLNICALDSWVIGCLRYNLNPTGPLCRKLIPSAILTEQSAKYM